MSKLDRFVLVKDRVEIVKLDWGDRKVDITSSLERAIRTKQEMEVQYPMSEFQIHRLVLAKGGL